MTIRQITRRMHYLKNQRKIKLNIASTGIKDRIIWNWIFIHFCGQMIGQWSKKQTPNTIVNVLISNIGLSTLRIPVLCFLLIGGKSPIWGTLVVITYLLLLTISLKKPFIKIINISELKLAYQQTSRQQKIFNFIIAVLTIPFSILLSVLSFKLLGIFS